jgi:hypothetical protein
MSMNDSVVIHEVCTSIMSIDRTNSAALSGQRIQGFVIWNGLKCTSSSLLP